MKRFKQRITNRVKRSFNRTAKRTKAVNLFTKIHRGGYRM